MVFSIIGALIIGTIIGVLARVILPGKQNIKIWLTILVGFVAALLGTFIASRFGFDSTRGFNWREHGLQLLLAIIGVGVVGGFSGRKRGVAH